MICEIVSYTAPPGLDRDGMIEDAMSVVPKWQAQPELIRKHFLWSSDREKCCGVYLWKSREAAERAHDAAWREAVENRTGQAPEISYFDAFMILDNEAGDVTVFPEVEAQLAAT